MTPITFPPPAMNIEPENCPEAVKQWYYLTSLPKNKRKWTMHRDLSLQAKKHLLYLGWKFWYVDKKEKWELRYTSPVSGKNYISLTRACKGCIEEDGGYGNLQNPKENNVLEYPTSSQPKKETTESRKLCKKRQRDDKDDELGEGFISMTGRRGKSVRSIKRMRQNGFILEDERSLLDPQKEVLSSQQNGFVEEEQVDDCGYRNDSICAACCYGGELVLCDGCPSSFHLRCLGLIHVPDGEWFCPVCSCKICRRPRCRDDSAHNVGVNSVLVCHQCEGKYHIGCLKDPAPAHMEKKEDDVGKGNWFCCRDCEEIFFSLHELLGKTINVAPYNLTWTLLNAVKRDGSGENESKLSAALDVLHESFDPVIDVFSGRDVIADVVFSRGSEDNRLNYRGFYTVVLERDKEVVCVATVRIFGKRVAEIPFVATKMQCRRQGMCGILMNEIEKLLTYLGVERLILPSSYTAVDTWTKSFDFVKMKPSEKSQLLDYVFLNFEGTLVCHKPLLQQTYV